MYWYQDLYNLKKRINLVLMLACDIPKSVEKLVPKAISIITDKSCDVQLDNYLRVIYEKPVVQKQFGVCVKGLRFGAVDMSVRLIEWLELVRILGADKVFLYYLSAQKNMNKVFDYYIDQVLSQFSVKFPNCYFLVIF
jgi:hypothetical protein